MCTFIPMKLKRAVRSACKRRGMSLAGLAQHLGIHVNTLRSVMNGRHFGATGEKVRSWVNNGGDGV